MYEQAIAEFQTAVQLSGGSSVFVANLARAYAGASKTNEAVRILDDLKKHSAAGASNASQIAAVYAALGNNDEAMSWVAKGYEERFNPGVLTRPGFDPLRSDPRFQEALRRIGLPR
jgi:predicted Zn-dependent protease